LKSGSRVTVRLYTTLNETLVEQYSLEIDAWCTTMGTFPVRIPDQYFVVLSGLTPKGESITMIEGVRGVMDLRPAAAPAPAPAAPPAAPTALRATPINATMVRLDWTDHARNETGFTIDVQSSWGGFTAGAVVNATSATIGTLQPATQHCFAVAAVNDAGQSTRSTVCTVTPREVELVTVTSGAGISGPVTPGSGASGTGAAGTGAAATDQLALGLYFAHGDLIAQGRRNGRRIRVSTEYRTTTRPFYLTITTVSGPEFRPRGLCSRIHSAMCEIQG
jgi:hypothetical protein